MNLANFSEKCIQWYHWYTLVAFSLDLCYRVVTLWDAARAMVFNNHILFCLLRWANSVFPSSCNIWLQEQKLCHPIKLQKDLNSALWLAHMVDTVATGSCKNLEKCRMRIINSMKISVMWSLNCWVQPMKCKWYRYAYHCKISKADSAWVGCSLGGSPRP